MWICILGGHLDSDPGDNCITESELITVPVSGIQIRKDPEFATRIRVGTHFGPKFLQKFVYQKFNEDPDSRAFWNRMRRIRIQKFKKRSKMLNQHKIILLLPVLFLSFYFFFKIKWYNCKIIINRYYFQIL